MDHLIFAFFALHCGCGWWKRAARTDWKAPTSADYSISNTVLPGNIGQTVLMPLAKTSLH
jgi:hypothetical protein